MDYLKNKSTIFFFKFLLAQTPLPIPNHREKCNCMSILYTYLIEILNSTNNSIYVHNQRHLKNWIANYPICWEQHWGQVRIRLFFILFFKYTSKEIRNTYLSMILYQDDFQDLTFFLPHFHQFTIFICCDFLAGKSVRRVHLRIIAPFKKLNESPAVWYMILTSFFDFFWLVLK